MGNDYQGEKFLDRLYKDLYMSDEVMHTATSSDSKEERIRKYLERLENVERIAKDSKHNGTQLLKEMYYDKYVIKEEDVPDSYFKHQQQMALDRGYGHTVINERVKQEMIRNLITDQKESLDNWLDYLMGDDHIYPEWFKYYAFQGMLRLGSYNKETGSFNRRTDSTTTIFVDLDREALALLYDYLCKSFDNIEIEDDDLQRLIDGGSFGEIYGYLLKQLDNTRKELNGVDGIWIKYNKGSEPDELVNSLAGIETARMQLKGGDFYVYYTKDNEGEYRQPRIAIRMEGNSIGEIRGIGKNQNLESEIGEVLDEKLEEFPDRDRYKKKVSDMEKLTKIYKEYQERDLTKEEIRFIYEVDDIIEGFGYQKDPRIKEILNKRNFKKDLAYLFDCNEDEISDDISDVLNGKKLKYFKGDLDLSGLESAEYLVLPRTVNGDLDLRRLKSAEGLVLPTTVRGNVVLDLLKSAKGLVLPDIINGSLYLRGLESAEGLELPCTVNGDLDLRRLKSAKGLNFPRTVNGVWLQNLEKAEDVILPDAIDEDLNLRSLKSAKNVVLPNTINGSLDLRGLESAEGVVLPSTINGAFILTNLRNPDGIIVTDNFKCGNLIAYWFTLEDLMMRKGNVENNKVKKKDYGYADMLIISFISYILSLIGVLTFIYFN